MSYEGHLQRLWDESNIEEPVDEEVELADEEDKTVTRESDSDSVKIVVTDEYICPQGHIHRR